MTERAPRSGRWRAAPAALTSAALAWVGLAGPVLAQDGGTESATRPDRGPRVEEGRDVLDVAVAPVELEAHVGYLASDELGGRDTASPGEALAVAYLAERLAAAGWEPAGDDGFLQRVPLEIGRPEGEPTLVGIDAAGEPVEFAFGVDFTVYDWAPVDARLELVVAEDEEARPEAPGGALYVPASGAMRRSLAEELAARGEAAPAVLLLRGPRSAGRPVGRLPGGRLTRASGGASAPAVLRLRGALLEAVEAGTLSALELDLNYAVERLTAHNVVGRLPGVGTPEAPGLAEEAVVLSAHLDHLGTVEPDGAGGRGASEAPEEEPDRIFNGADDDATGCAVLVEVAEALALGPRPAREVICLFATGEERGLLGSLEYLDRPATPLERTVYNLNFEMLGRPDDLAGGAGELWFTGFERTTVGPALAELGVALTPDPRPEMNFYERSDNIVFVRQGIPGQTLSSYNMHSDYHTPRDEWWRIDYDHMAAAAELAVRAARAIVDAAVPVDWLETPATEGR
jgi:hypothetical protein